MMDFKTICSNLRLLKRETDWMEVYIDEVKDEYFSRTDVNLRITVTYTFRDKDIDEEWYERRNSSLAKCYDVVVSYMGSRILAFEAIAIDDEIDRHCIVPQTMFKGVSEIDSLSSNVCRIVNAMNGKDYDRILSVYGLKEVVSGSETN